MEKFLNMSENFIVAVDEIDFLERLKPSAIMQYFQDLATAHADILGIGFKEMIDQNLIWVLTKLSFKVLKYPVVGEQIRVVTYPRSPGMAEATRDYYIYDSSNNLIIVGTSKWCVLDKGSRMIRRCAPLFNYPQDAYKDVDALSGGCPKLAPFSEDEINSSFCRSFTTEVTDLDRNVHMNNARYGDVILNTCSIEKLYDNNIVSMDINFLSELVWGNKFSCRRIEVGEGETAFEATNDETKKTVFRAKLTWEKR